MPYDSTDFRPNALGLPEDVADIIHDELLPWLRAGGDDACRFYYPLWGDKCGTAACIGGWLHNRIGLSAFMQIMGSHPVLDGLFNGHRSGTFPADQGYADVTGPIAASCVEHMMATGDVDWTRAFGV